MSNRFARSEAARPTRSSFRLMSARIIKYLAIVALPIAGVMIWVEFNWANLLTLIGSFSTAIIALHVESRNASVVTPQVVAPPAAPLPRAVQRPRYAELLGQRLIYLREKTLKMTLREMTEFLGLESVTQLERYESGGEEFPLPLVRKVEEFFFLKGEHLTAGSAIVFKSFHLNSENVGRFLTQGFRPTLLCDPDNRHGLLCYLVFSKREQGLMRLVTANRPGSFASSGGGRLNIQDLINPMLEAKMSQRDVSIVTARANEWQAVINSCFYDRQPFGRAGSADWECMKIFERWFKESADSRARWNQLED